MKILLVVVILFVHTDDRLQQI